VYYAATIMEAQLCAAEHVAVVGGGNSAGQAAVFLAQTAERVHLIFRSSSLVDSMSRYLIDRIEDNPKIAQHPRTEIVSLDGKGHLEQIGLRERLTGRIDVRAVRHVFTMMGAIPNTHWLDGLLVLDDKGFIKTGTDLSREDLVCSAWPLERAPHLVETSRPGVFAVGDVRSGSVKRVTSAAGDGPIAIAAVHRALRDEDAVARDPSSTYPHSAKGDLAHDNTTAVHRPGRGRHARR
jgi:thioredoxin reductase (NADPH)